MVHLNDAEVEDEWESFKNKYKKSYESIEEELECREVFIGVKEWIDEHNAEVERGEHSFKMRINQAADFIEESDEIESKDAKNDTDEYEEEDEEDE